MNESVNVLSLCDPKPLLDSDEGSHPSIRRKSGQASVVSLFAGIGGFDLAFSKSGARIAYHCEVDRFCQAVLRRHWPSVPLASDIRELTADSIPGADVWTAGFPCQDVSLARGNHGRSGLKGHHTSLFFELVRLLGSKKPKVILLENVVGLLNSHSGADFAVILRSLTDLGYAVSWRVLNARYFGAPQSRSRVFMVAWLGDYRKAVRALYEPQEGTRKASERQGFLTATKHPRNGAIVPEIAYCVAATSGRHTGNDWSRSYVSYADRVRRPTPTESERLQGFPAGWTIPASDHREPVRGFDSERYRAAGNAVAVPVVEWIAKRVLSLLREPKASDGDFLVDVHGLAPDLTREARSADFVRILQQVDAGNFSYRWKSGGCAWHHSVAEGNVSAAPSRIVRSRFVDVLDDGMPDDSYFLTPNAAAGIIRRADQVGRNLFAPMRSALEKMLIESEKPAAEPKGKVAAGGTVGRSGIHTAGASKRRHVA